MRTNRIIFVATSLILSVLAAGGRHASAQDIKVEIKEGKGESKVKAGKSKPGKADKQKAKQYGQQGLSLFKKGDYEAALEYFILADEMAPSPSTTFNIARCLDNLYKYREAYLAYSKYIESGDKTNVKEAKEAMARIEAMPVILKIITVPAGASVLIDGQEVTFQETPIVSEVKGGKKLKVTIKKQGFENHIAMVEISFGGEKRIEVTLTPAKEAVAPPKVKGEGKKEAGKKGEKKKEMVAKEETKKEEVKKEEVKEVEIIEEEENVEEQKEEKKEDAKETVKLTEGAGKKTRMVPISVSLAVGATASTTKKLGSYIDASVGLSFLIKGGFVGIALDNLFFSDSYMLAAYPAGGYTLNVWKDLSIVFTAGFGFAYLRASRAGYDESGAVVVEEGNHWDLVAHADVRLRYKVGPVILQAIPVHANILIGVGSVQPAPLAQFAFLAGIAYEYP